MKFQNYLISINKSVVYGLLFAALFFSHAQSIAEYYYAPTASAGGYYWQTSTSGDGNVNWNTNPDSTGTTSNAIPSAGNTYFIINGQSGVSIRNSNAFSSGASNVFGGDELYVGMYLDDNSNVVYSPGFLGLKINLEMGTEASGKNLHLGAGTIANLSNTGNSAIIRYGTIYIEGSGANASKLECTDTNLNSGRSLIVNSKVSGSGDVKITTSLKTGGTNDFQVQISNPSNDFSGNWLVQDNSMLSATGLNSLGVNSSVSLNNSVLNAAANQTIKNLTFNSSTGATKGAGTLTVTNAITGPTTGAAAVSNAVILKGENVQVGASVSFASLDVSCDIPDTSITSATTNVTFGSGDYAIGTGTTDHFYSGYYTQRTGGATSRPINHNVDFSAANSLAINVGNMILSANASTSGANLNDQSVSTVTLSQSNAITAQNLVLADSGNMGMPNYPTTLNLGANNVLNIDNIYISGGYSTFVGKGNGKIAIENGGKITLNAANGTGRTNINMGYSISAGANSIAEIDISNCSADSFLNLGTLTMSAQKAGTTSTGGSSTSTFTMNNGTVDVLNINMANYGGGSNRAVTSTFNLNGGALKAKTIQKMSDNAKAAAIFNFTGGTLENQIFGTTAINLNLTQQGGVFKTWADETQSVDAFTVQSLINGYYKITGNSQINIDVTNLALNDMSSVALYSTGTISLLNNSSLVINLLDDDLTYAPNDRYNLLYAATGWGDFDLSKVNLVSGSGQNWTLGKEGSYAYAYLATEPPQSVPEPAAWLLLTLCLPALLLRFTRWRV